MIVIVDYGMGNLRSVSKALESLGASVRVSSDPADVVRADKLILPGVGAFPAAMRELAVRKLIDPIKDTLAKGAPYLGICLGLQLLFEESEEGEGAKGLSVLAGRVPRFSFNSKLETRNSKLKVPHMGWNQVTRSPRSEVRGQKEQASLALLAKDLRIDIYRTPGAAVEGAVRVCHVPSGIDVTCEDEPSQLRNKEKAVRMLQEKLAQVQLGARGDGCPLLKDIPDGSFFYFVHSYYADPADRAVVALESEYGGRFAAMVWRENLYATQFHPEKSQAVGLQLLKNFIDL